ncbi:hypothetical protein RB195_010829 [Necator americanus]|uniref:CBS domain-containing protein n=1 Tax=Necator americanus TaxID=51031 RepID=A0ABR1CZM2_NECAM
MSTCTRKSELLEICGGHGSSTSNSPRHRFDDIGQELCPLHSPLMVCSPSDSSASSPHKRTAMFRIGSDEVDGSETERFMPYTTISSLSIINSPPRKTKRTKLVQRVFRSISDDWIYLGLLGVSTALCSLVMETAIERLLEWHTTTYDFAVAVESEHHHAFPFFVWTGYAVILVMSSAVLAHYVSPQTIGSGIPELKTIMRGFILKEYLSFRTLICKMIGLTLSLGSGLPLGKEGPFVHISSAVASQLSRYMTDDQGPYTNEARSHEMLAAGCAVGVACTFGTPIGGVLFSVEVTSAYFAVRNYWRGFFAALCAASTFRIVRIVLKSSEMKMGAYGQTRFPDDSFLPEELPLFAFIGLLCGLAGALFIKCHRSLVLRLKKSNFCKKFVVEKWLLYPIVVSFAVASITYPQGFGQFLSGKHKFSQTLRMFLSNCTWTVSNVHKNSCPDGFLDQWAGGGTEGVCLALALFTSTFFVLSMVSSTLPIPAGIFMPVFVIGASFGRLVGESMALLFPDGIRPNNTMGIYPGVYAVVGAASFCGSVTHTISVAVIVFELTGQLMHILPVMIAVLIANIVCSYFQPSIYDSIILTKELPYLPELSHFSHEFHTIVAEQIMVTDVKVIWKGMTYYQMKTVIEENRRLRSFPVVLDQDSRILLGSVSRKVLSDLIEGKIGNRARQMNAIKRLRSTIFSPEYRNESSTSVEFHNDNESNKQLTSRRKASNQQPPKEEKLTRGMDSDCSKLLHCVGADGSCSECDRVVATACEVERGLRSNDCLVEERKSSLKNILHRSLHRLTLQKYKKGAIDLYGEDRAKWEIEQLNNVVDLQSIHIDSAPFQIVENTSIFKIHSVFSLLGLRRAYVTKLGRLVGVVSFKELRAAIESINNTRPAVGFEDDEAAKQIQHCDSLVHHV